MHIEHACMAKQYSLQVRIFIEKDETDECFERLRRKTARQVINEIPVAALYYEAS